MMAGTPKFLKQFADQVITRGSHVAILDTNVSMSYETLDTQANQLAHYLISQGVESGQVVAVSLVKCPMLFVSLLAIVKCGAAFVVLDTEQPQSRLALIMAQLDQPFLLTADAQGGKSTTQCARWIRLDQWVAASWSVSTPEVQISEQDLAYIMFTSGSTGTPKGVKCSYGSLDYYLSELVRQIELKETERYLHSASFGFSSAIRQWWLPLVQGATLVVATPFQVQDTQILLGLIHGRKVTVVDTVASVWRSMLASKRHNLSDSCLTKIILSGGLFTAQLLEALRLNKPQSTQIYNLYGQTETLGVSLFCVSEDYQPIGEYVAVGRVYAGTQIAIKGASGETLVDGVAGELWVSGEQVMRGYTCESENVRVIHRDSDNRRWYKTGDIAQRLSECAGSLQILGRMDYQVKILGVRIETAEVERALESCSEVLHAVVTGQKDATNETRLIAYIVPVTEQKRLSATLRRKLRSMLPESMIPARFIALTALPMTINGKLDFSALPDVVWESSSEQYVAPVSEMECSVVNVVEQTLGLNRVGLRDNFIEIGGNSLLAMQVVTRLNEQYRCGLKLHNMIELDSIADLAGFIASVIGEEVDCATDGEDGWL